MVVRVTRWLLLSAALLSGCRDLPRDPDGTLDRVRREHVVRVGQVAGASAADAADARRVLDRVIARTDSRATLTSGPVEPLLLALEAGTLDLVVGGRFDEKTPWKTRVTLGPELAPHRTPAGRTAAHVVARNGENEWIMLVQRETIAAGGRE